MNDSLRTMESKKRWLTMGAWALMMAMPFLQIALISLAIGKNGFASYPVWSDELDYWRSLFSFVRVGFSAGYNGLGEYPPMLGTLSVHGLTPILLYGVFCKLFGLGVHAIVWCNAAWVSLAALTFCLVVRPRAAVAGFISALFLAYVPAVLYAATSMTELFNYALLLFYLAFLLRYGKTGGKWALALCWLTVIFGCFYRITYFVLFGPLLWLQGGKRFSWKLLGYGALALGLSAGVYVLSAMLTAPFPSGFLYNWMRAGDAVTFVRMFLSHAKANVLDYFVRSYGKDVENSLRALYCLLMGLTLVGAFVRVRRQGKGFGLRVGIDPEVLGYFLMLFIPFAVVIAIYEANDWTDFRTLAPFLWGVGAMMALRGRKVFSAVMLAGSLALLVFLCTQPAVGAFKDQYRFTPKPYSENVRLACEKIVYDPDATDPFANSIRADIGTMQVLMEVDPRMGLMYGWFTKETTGKCRWILTDHLKIVVEGYKKQFSKKGAKVYRQVETAEP